MEGSMDGWMGSHFGQDAIFKMQCHLLECLCLGDLAMSPSKEWTLRKNKLPTTLHNIDEWYVEFLVFAFSMRSGNHSCQDWMPNTLEMTTSLPKDWIPTIFEMTTSVPTSQELLHIFPSGQIIKTSHVYFIHTIWTECCYCPFAVSSLHRKWAFLMMMMNDEHKRLSIPSQGCALWNFWQTNMLNS